MAMTRSFKGGLKRMRTEPFWSWAKSQWRVFTILGLCGVFWAFCIGMTGWVK